MDMRRWAMFVIWLSGVVILRLAGWPSWRRHSFVARKYDRSIGDEYTLDVSLIVWKGLQCLVTPGATGLGIAAALAADLYAAGQSRKLLDNITVTGPGE